MQANESTKYIARSDKTVDEATRDLEAAVKAHGFGVLNILDLRGTLEGKGYGIAHDCRVLDVCNPAEAQKVLNENMSMNMALPCRVSVYEEDDGTRIGTIRPTALLAALSDSPELARVAEEVESKIIAMIEDAR